MLHHPNSQVEWRVGDNIRVATIVVQKVAYWKPACGAVNDIRAGAWQTACQGDVDNSAEPDARIVQATVHKKFNNASTAQSGSM
jgi:hypothetical protein